MVDEHDLSDVGMRRVTVTAARSRTLRPTAVAVGLTIAVGASWLISPTIPPLLAAVAAGHGLSGAI